MPARNATEAEEWRPVVGMEGKYEVSDRGRVRSLTRFSTEASRWGGTKRRIMHGRILSPKLDRCGRLEVNLSGLGMRRIHRLVLEAFVGPRPAGMEGCHNNGNPSDNRVANLRWDTHRANVDDVERHGTRPRGERHRSAKVKNKTVSAILADYAKDQRYGALVRIGKKFGITRQRAWDICRGKSWQHLRQQHVE